jgi:omega-hydroxy-beta-dihydromenaquinone-9 sulfotransferase
MGWRERMQVTVGPGILAGVTLQQWRAFRRDNPIDSRYRLRAGSITFNAVVNSAMAKREERQYGAEAESAQIQPPLFILGHWRSGTTYLHHLLSLDTRFSYPTVYQTSYPSTFLTTETRSSRLLGSMLPATRPMDNVRQNFAAPNEDEFAICAMTGLSPCMSWIFPRRADHYDRYLAFDGVDVMELQRWKETFTDFLRKVTLKYDRPLLLKSPPHTARVRILLGMFPYAKFVHIHREPYTVFQSTRHTMQTMSRITGLQSPPSDELENGIINRYRTMYDRYLEDRKSIPAGRLHEVSFESLECEPLEEMRRLYDALDLGDFAVVEHRIAHHVHSVRDFQKNRFAPLPEETRFAVKDAWQPFFQEWGYKE